MLVTQWLDALILSPSEKRALGRTLGDRDLSKHQLEELAQIAFEEYVQWLIGRRRFATVSEADAYRVFRCFNNLRNEPPTVDSLANDFAFSPGKAVSIISRLRYGEARTLARLANAKAIQTISASLDGHKKTDKKIGIWLEASSFDVVSRAAAEIMLTTDAHASGRKWEGVEWPEVKREKYVSLINATPKMWSHIKDLLSEFLREEGGLD